MQWSFLLEKVTVEYIAVCTVATVGRVKMTRSDFITFPSQKQTL